MKTIVSIVAPALFFFLLLIPSNAYALCQVCFNSSGDCYTIEADCKTVNCNCSCQDIVASFYDPVIYSKNGLAWFMKDDVKFKIGSDKLEAFMSEINERYPLKTTENDSLRSEKIKAEYATFFKEKDDGLVSEERLQILSSETGFPIEVLDETPAEEDYNYWAPLIIGLVLFVFVVLRWRARRAAK